MRTRQLSLFEQSRYGDPSLSDEQVVQAIARQILDDAEAKPPVDVNVLASVCGIATVEHRQAGPAGMLFRRDGGLVASIRAEDGLKRGRFTVLHEGGHTFLVDFLRGVALRCGGPTTREERLCDIAAAEMLLPREFFVPDLMQVEMSLEGVKDLASRYVASNQATAMRLIALTDDRVALLAFKERHKPSERGREGSCPPRLRLQWGATSGSWPYLRRHKSVEPLSPIGRAWLGEEISEVATIDELTGQPVGRLNLHARRYGDTVLALVVPQPRTRQL